MGKGSNKSKKHHWWPVALQSYWADVKGDVHWVDPDGKITKKRYWNRQIGQKRHGHTMLRNGGVWESTFEELFNCDSDAKAIVDSLIELKPPDHPQFLFFKFLDLVEPFNGIETEPSRPYKLSEAEQRRIVLLIASLLMRAPSKRHQFAGLPVQFGLPYNEDVAASNLFFQFRTIKETLAKGLVPLVSFAGIHTRGKNFIVGDGYLDWASHGFGDRRFTGCALLPLTPNFCLYVRFRNQKSSFDPDFAAINVSSAVVEEINCLTQIYSKNQLFYRGKVPNLTDEFRRREFLQHSEFKLPLIDQLDELIAYEVHRLTF